MKVAALLLVLSIFLVLVTVNCAPISDLPGYTGPLLSMDSGYLTVNKTTGKSLFYWLIRSQSTTPSQDPLVLWLQGGPGCSGLYGLFLEHGPFFPNYQGGVTYNTLSWSRVANMLYIEAPCGVGFSYSNHTSDYRTDDNQTAHDNYVFLQAFMEAFPEFQGRDLWITGESYGGVYVPTLVYRILNASSTALYKQLVGFMVGNPLFDCATVNAIYNDVEVKILYWHGTVSYGNYLDWTTNGCETNFTSYCRLLYNDIISSVGTIDQPTKSSLMNRNAAYKKYSVLPKVGAERQPSLNPDNILFDFCTGNGTLDFDVQTSADCKVTIDNLLDNYLNREDVKTAIHATHPIPGKRWQACSTAVRYEFGGESMTPYYAAVGQLKPETRVLVYSGDLDVLTCPFPTAQICLAELNATQKLKWQPWFVNGATVGYVEVFDQYTYATVKGAGHEAPEYQPLAAFNLFSRFLANAGL